MAIARTDNIKTILNNELNNIFRDDQIQEKRSLDVQDKNKPQAGLNANKADSSYSEQSKDEFVRKELANVFDLKQGLNVYAEV